VEVTLTRVESVFLGLARMPFVLLFLVPGLAIVGAAGQSGGLSPSLPLVHVDNGPNSAGAQARNYVVVVSLRGFRWDYAKRENAAHLLALARQGSWAPEGMVPSYPALSFADGYTIASGLYPGHHGIVSDEFLDTDTQKRFSISDPAAVRDGTWYSGTPLWSLAEREGMRTACLFWPGSEAKIAGFRPTWYADSQAKLKSTAALQQARVDDVLVLLRLPAEQRPHLIFMSFEEPEIEAVQYGPNAAQTRAAELGMDALIGKLKGALDATKLPIDLVVVSEHGFAQVQDGWITLDQLADLQGFDTKSNLLYAQNEQDRVRVYERLKKASSQFMVYRRKNAPADLNISQNARAGDPVIIATGPFAIRARMPATGQTDQPPSAGLGGFDARKAPEMKASFFAAGPDIVKGKTVAPFEDVNLYPWLAHILGFAPGKNDGNLNILAGTLRDGGSNPADETGH
jgi:predicted AlkP superfamily pyrophosphatase or phosphodiesterase